MGQVMFCLLYTSNYRKPAYFFDSSIYENRVFDSKGVADPDIEIQFGPNIKDWPKMPKLPENLLLQVTAEIHDPVTTTDELIPSGETSSYRSNPIRPVSYTHLVTFLKLLLQMFDLWSVIFQIQILAMLTLSVVLFRNVKQWVLIFTAAG